MSSPAKIIGGILLITGTSIGGGMLALPVATAGGGLVYAALFLFLCWLTMTLSALFMLEVNLWLPKGSNLISMARSTLGKKGEMTAWVSYLFLLYTLMSAYISGGSDILQSVLSAIHVNSPYWLTTVAFVAALGTIVKSGIQRVDQANRLLMLAKLGIFFFLLVVIAPKAKLSYLSHGHLSTMTSSIMVLIASYGFASIVPSLRDYFDNDIKTLKRVVIIGSLIPLVCYLAWIAVIMGAIPQTKLAQLMQGGHTVSHLVQALKEATGNPFLAHSFASFSAVCMLTAFLGVSLGLFDFLADGLKLKKQGSQSHLIFLATFLPPLLIVLINPNVYLKAIHYAGVCCVLLLIALPSLMLYRGRYQLSFQSTHLKVRINKSLIVGVMLLSVALIFLAFQQG